MKHAGTIAMASGMLLAYGTAGVYSGHYLLASRSPARRWVYVCGVDDLAPGDSRVFRTPAGERISIARHGEAPTVEAFVALSSTCPHLGCQVHWQPAESRFFCPCHNGAFAPDGTALIGPPADEGTDLVRYPLRVENGALFVEAVVGSES